MNITCRDCKKFIAWGKEVTPVRCKECRTKNTAIKRLNAYNPEVFRKQLAAHHLTCKDVVCTFGDW